MTWAGQFHEIWVQADQVRWSCIYILFYSRLLKFTSLPSEACLTTSNRFNKFLSWNHRNCSKQISGQSVGWVHSDTTPGKAQNWRKMWELKMTYQKGVAATQNHGALTGLDHVTLRQDSNMLSTLDTPSLEMIIQQKPFVKINLLKYKTSQRPFAQSSQGVEIRHFCLHLGLNQRRVQSQSIHTLQCLPPLPFFISPV